MTAVKPGTIVNVAVGAIVGRLVNHDTPGLRTVFTVPPQELARTHGHRDGRQAFSSADDLLSLYLAKRLSKEQS